MSVNGITLYVSFGYRLSLETSIHILYFFYHIILYADVKLKNATVVSFLQYFSM